MEESENLKGTLNIIQQIFNFLHISTINNDKDYLMEMAQFGLNVQMLFKYRSKTFLNDGNVSFYFYSLRFYSHKVAKITYKRHRLGMGLFTMQGYKRRNKESKNTIYWFCTTQHKSNKLLVNNVRRLLQFFYWILCLLVLY